MKKYSAAALAMVLTCVLTAATGNRRVTENKLSPSADTSMTAGGHTITIEYNAPSARGRKVEGGLIPNGKPWRLGADAATTLTSDADLMIGDLHVPKGVHTLYLQGGENEWTLIVNKQTGQWGTQYEESQDLGRVPMKLTKTSEPAEKLQISLKAGTGGSGVLEVTWGSTQGTAPIMVH